MKLKRLIIFLRRHIFRNPLYLVVYAWFFVRSRCLVKVSFLPPESIRAILEDGKSFIRYGDGEIHLMLGGSIHYEPATTWMSDSLYDVVTSYNKESPYVLGINEGPMTTTNSELRRLGFFHCWLPLKVYSYLYFPRNVKYIDSSIFYYKNAVAQYLGSYLSSRQVLVVTHGDNIEMLVKNEEIPFKMEYIKTKAFNASEDYNDILQEIQHKSENLSKATVLLACGPISKILAARLSQEGIQCIDIGIGVELMYTNKDKSTMVIPAAPYRLQTLPN